VEPLLQELGGMARDALGVHAHAVLAAMTPVAGAGKPLAMPMGRHQVVGALRRLLLADANGKPVLLVVDDAQAADDASAEVLVHLAASGPPLFVLFAARPALPALLQGHVSRMMRAGTLRAVDLGPLTRDESGLLAARAARQPLSPEAANDIARRSEGLPFAVVELARARSPLNAAAAIAERLCDVDPDAMEALRRLALAAEHFDVSVALAMAREGASDDGTACLDRTPSAPGLVGHHWLAAGNIDAAAPCSLAAAREAFRLGAHMDVLRHVEPLLEHRPALPEALALRAEALDALARPGTLAAYDAAAAVAPPALSHELKAKRALAQVKMSDPSGALEFLKDVHPSTVPGRLAEALAYSGAAALGFGDPSEGTRRAAEVRRIALETGDEGTLVIASWAQAAAAPARGDLHGSVWADLKETSHLPQLAVRAGARRAGVRRCARRARGFWRGGPRFRRRRAPVGRRTLQRDGAMACHRAGVIA
jgi:hypothetical protein